MNLIKKFLVLTGALSLAASSTAIVVACGQDNELHILMVPNIKEEALDNFAIKIAPLIQQELAVRGFKKKVVVSVAKDASAAALSTAAGNAAISYLPVYPYYQYSIKNNENTIHQLFISTGLAMNSEYSTATGTTKEEKVAQMNKNGSLSDMQVDQNNIYKLVLNSAQWNKYDQIITKESDQIMSTYYRGYQYMSKKTLKKYLIDVANDLQLDSELKNAWTNIVKTDPKNSDYAIFDDEKALNDSPQNLHDYWKVIWDIYLRASEDKGIGFADDKASAAGRINPIWTMMEAYILSHDKSLNKQSDIDEARDVVLKLLSDKFKEKQNYSVNVPHDLMHGTGADASTLSIGVGWGTARTHYSAGDYTNEQVMDELMVLTTSHGIIKDGAVYSERYFKNRRDLLKAVQDTFIDLIRNNEVAKKYFREEAYHFDYNPSPLDEAGIKESEDSIKDYYNSDFIKKAEEISKAIKPVGGSN